MYCPEQFAELNIATMHDLIRARPLTTLVTQSFAGLEVNQIPLLLADQPGPFGVLRGHVARANSLWQEHPEEVDVIAVFHGPETYITPSWYVSKAVDGKVVPTWNYATVQAKGKLQIVDNAEWLWSQLEALTEHNEKFFVHQWSISDAPRDYIIKLLESIVGIEIVISDLKGKWKVSQNRLPPDRRSVESGLRQQGSNEMADLVKSRRHV